MATDVFLTARGYRDCAHARGARYKNQNIMKTFREIKTFNFVALDVLGLLIKMKTSYTDILFITDRMKDRVGI